ncbi:MAG: FecR domain-containing protein [Bacteroidia bacterium]
MENYNQNIEDLIAKYLAGEADAEETSDLMLWRAANHENEKYFETLERIFFESATLKNDTIVDTDAAWNKLKKEIRNQKTKILNPGAYSVSYRNSNLKIFLRVAAAVVFVALLSTIYLFYFKENIQPVNIASANETKTVLLPDSTSVFLNKNTTLAYTFTNDKREITLTGEAFFEVKHDEGKPFIIHANDLKIEDIGTAFNVRALENSDSIEIMVTEGEVKLTTAINAGYENNCLLRPGQQAVYHKKTKRIVQSVNKDANALAYRTKVFVFENASLQAAVQKLMEVYETEIIINDKIKNCHITSTFKNEKIDAIMDVIATTLNLKLTKNENKFILEGDGCEE